VSIILKLFQFISDMINIHLIVHMIDFSNTTVIAHQIRPWPLLLAWTVIFS
jgi:hypothetical protein